MHLYRFILLALSISSAAANGVRAGYERVWLWYAYQIDLTLPVDQRKIGFRCIQFTQAGQACNPTYQRMSRGNPVGPVLPNYEACRGTRADGSCYFFELMGWIKRTRFNWNEHFLQPTSTTDPSLLKKGRNDPETALRMTVLAEQQNLLPDPARTAAWLATSHPPRLDLNGDKTSRYNPLNVMKGAPVAYDTFLDDIARHSIATITNMDAATKANNQENLDKIKVCLRGVIVEREIDHSKSILEVARNTGMKLATRTENGFTGDIVDWNASRSLPEHQANPTVVDDFRAAYYTSNSAQEHLDVMDAYRRIEASYLSPACIGP